MNFCLSNSSQRFFQLIRHYKLFEKDVLVAIFSNG